MTKPNITAFHGIFEQRLKNIIKDIKKVRKDPSSKDKVKRLVAEAKQLKKDIKKEKKSPTTYQLEIPVHCVDGTPNMGIIGSADVKVTEARCVGGLIIVEFTLKEKVDN
jgi:hypothetical protein